MLAGMSIGEKAKYGLSQPERYFYLNQGGSSRLETRNDADDFIRTVSAMEVLNFDPNKQETAFSILAAILHIGNLSLQNSKVRQIDSNLKSYCGIATFSTCNVYL